MGSASSKNTQDIDMKTLTKQLNDNKSTESCKNLCDIRFVVTDVDVGSGKFVFDVDGANTSCKNYCELEGKFTDYNQQQATQDVSQELMQEAESKIKGVNILNFSDAENAINTNLNSTIDLSSHVDQSCIAQNSIYQGVNISKIKAGEFDLSIKNFEAVGDNEAFLDCAFDNANFQDSYQTVSQTISQKATATTEGFDPVALLGMYIVAVLVTMGGVAAVAKYGLTTFGFIMIAVAAVLTVCFTVRNAWVYHTWVHEGDYKLPHKNETKKYYGFPYFWDTNFVYEKLLVKGVDKIDETGKIKYKTNPSGDPPSNIFLVPYSSIGNQERYESEEEAIQFKYNIEDSEPNEKELLKQGLMNPSLYGANATDGGAPEMAHFKRSIDYDIKNEPKTPLDAQKVLEETDSEYIAFEWFGYFFNTEGRKIMLSTPYTIFYKHLPEYFWNWDKINCPCCITGDCKKEDDTKNDGVADKCFHEDYDPCLGHIKQQLQGLSKEELSNYKSYQSVDDMRKNPPNDEDIRFYNEIYLDCPEKSGAPIIHISSQPLKFSKDPSKNVPIIKEINTADIPGFESLCEDKKQIAILRKEELMQKIKEGGGDPDEIYELSAAQKSQIKVLNDKKDGNQPDRAAQIEAEEMTQKFINKNMINMINTHYSPEEGKAGKDVKVLISALDPHRLEYYKWEDNQWVLIFGNHTKGEGVCNWTSMPFDKEELPGLSDAEFKSLNEPWDGNATPDDNQLNCQIDDDKKKCTRIGRCYDIIGGLGNDVGDFCTMKLGDKVKQVGKDAAIGAGAGTVVPGVGTAAGAVGGAIAGVVTLDDGPKQFDFFKKIKPNKDIPGSTKCQELYEYTSDPMRGGHTYPNEDAIAECRSYCCIDAEAGEDTPKPTDPELDGECSYIDKNQEKFYPNISLSVQLPRYPNTVGIKMYRDGTNMGKGWMGSNYSIIKTQYRICIIAIILLIISILCMMIFGGKGNNTSPSSSSPTPPASESTSAAAAAANRQAELEAAHPMGSGGSAAGR